MPASSQHWALCAEIVRQLPDTTVSIVSYPLAPNSPAPDTFPRLMIMYKRLLQEAEAAGEQVIVAGDSSGGNMALCLTLARLAEDENALCPLAITAICPSVNMRKDNPDIKKVEKHDPILRIPFITNNAERWRGEWDASTLEFPLLPQMFLRLFEEECSFMESSQVMTSCRQNAIMFRLQCEKAGVEGEWLHWDKQMHCFPLAWSYRLPESVEAKDWIIDVLRRS